MKLELFIPGIPKNANARSQWAKHAAASDRRKFRALAEQIGREHPNRATWPLPPMTLITARHISPVRRRRDPLGLAERLKPIVDGLVDAGLLVDDDENHVTFRLEHSSLGDTAGIHLTLEPGATP